MLPTVSPPFPRVRATLRVKFLLAVTLISALLTSAVLLMVQYRVRIHVRDEIGQSLRDSVVTFQRLQQQRGSTYEHAVELVATLPPLRAAMTSDDPATIQDASTMFWKLAGSDLFVLADRSGRIVAFHASAKGVDAGVARDPLSRGLSAGQSNDWWYIGGHLFEVFFEPIYFGATEPANVRGMLATGYEIDAGVAGDATRVASSQIAFGYDGRLVLGTVPPAQRDALATFLPRLTASGSEPQELRLGDERFLAASVRLSAEGAPVVTVTFLKSFDEATAFLRSLNRWIAASGAAAVLAGALLVFLVSTTFTRPLARLVAGVRALEQGDFDLPLEVRGRDEISDLTAAFARMRGSLRDAQGKLLEGERLATIGRMASTISHDLRHPLTAVLAYAEFLSERDLSDEQRKDFFQEIRIAVNRMLDEINSLLGFSKERAPVQPVHTRVDDVIDRAVKAVKALPEFSTIAITVSGGEECVGWFDPGKLERVMLNLIVNAAEAVCPHTGRIEIGCGSVDGGTEIRVADNGPGLPREVLDHLFEPFVSHGKEKGIGLGLTVVHNIMQQHHGRVTVERTGPAGTAFLLFFPARAGAAD
jgi:signal transduction histidine kinase